MGQKLLSIDVQVSIIAFSLQRMQGQELGGEFMRETESVLAVGMAEAGRRVGLSARTIADLVARNELPSRKVGRRRLIAVCDLETFVRDTRRIPSGEFTGSIK
jgi:excisionase family DNA binding protein